MAASTRQKCPMSCVRLRLLSQELVLWRKSLFFVIATVSYTHLDVYTRQGMTILREYVDRHISCKTDDRAQFRQMIDDSAKRTFDLVICWKTDRFARNRYDSAVVQKAAA